LRGSKYYVENFTEYPVEKVMANINLDTVGRLGDKKLLILNANSASEWKHICMGVGFVTGVESEIVTQQLYSGDQMSFIEKGVTAIHVFSGAHEDFSRPTDTADKIDLDGLLKVATFTKEALMYLIDREEPLSFEGKTEAPQHPGAHPGKRKVGTGSMPDFSYSGKGVRIGNISEGSPAAEADLQTGDIIIQVDDCMVENLQEYTACLKNYNPGDSAEFKFLRDDEEKATTLTFKAR